MPRDITVTLQDGTKHTYKGAPDDVTPESVSARAQKEFGQAVTHLDGGRGAPPGDPSFMDYARTNPFVGAPLQTLYRAGQGVTQLAAHGAASLSDLGGIAPNPVSERLRGFAGDFDKSVADQNKSYGDAKQRVLGASSIPKVQSALMATGELAGNLLNPAGLAGNAVRYAPGIINAAVRGGVSGLGFAASQPVENVDNYWGEKAKQAAIGTAAGAASGAAFGALTGEKLRPNAPPTSKQLKVDAGNAYDAATSEGVVIRQQSFKDATDKIAKIVQKEGLDDALHPDTTAAIKRLQSEVANGDLTLEKAETLRRVASSAFDSIKKSDKRLAHIVVDEWDDFIAGLKAKDIASNSDAQGAISSLAKARDLYSRSAKAATLERLAEKAKNAVGSNYSQAGYQTALRQQYRALANNERAMSRFSPAERAAILKVVRGGSVENVLRAIGRLAVRGPVSGLPAGAALYNNQPELAAALAGVGEVGRASSTQLSLRNARLAEEMMRRGPSPSPTPSQLPRPAPNNALGNIPNSLLIPMLLRQ